MRSTFLFLMWILSFHLASGQEVSVVKGRFSGFKFSKISLQSDESPMTGARDRFDGIVLDSGKFEVHAKLYVANFFSLFVDDVNVGQLFLCPGSDLSISLGPDGLVYEGSMGNSKEWNDALNSEFLNKYNLVYAQNHGANVEDIESLLRFLFKLKQEDLAGLDKHLGDFEMAPCEYAYYRYRVDYAIYTFLWSEFGQLGYSIESDAYQFMNWLPLDDGEASKNSLDYNRAISVYLFLKLRLENGWYDIRSFDSSSDAYNKLFYEKILSEIQNEDVRNLTLTRKVIGLLSAGSTSAVSLFKRYLNDCTDASYKAIAFSYYNEYLKLKKNISKQDLRIEALQGALFEKLKQHKGKVLYIDFWASWCRPCMDGLPFTKAIQEKYWGQPLEIVYVSIDDNIGNAEAAAKKLGLQGTVIHLNKEQSTEIRKRLQIQGIPHYTLIDKEGVIVSAKAPPPKSGAIESEINVLLNK